jgi:hypothetical protein
LDDWVTIAGAVSCDALRNPFKTSNLAGMLDLHFERPVFSVGQQLKCL